MERITITKPDDWHLHLRDDPYLESVAMHTASIYKRALIMPNLQFPIVDLDLARKYRDRILKVLPETTGFQPLMALYLTAKTTVDQIKSAKESGIILAIKMYPAGATTNSEFGIQTIEQCDAVFEKMQEIGLPLSVHGEVTDPDIDIFDREAVFIDRVLQVLTVRYPSLKIVLEHITTKEAVQFIQGSSARVAGTITPHHILLNRNNMLVGGIKAHHYCLPIVKSEDNRIEVLKAATSGDPKFFLGTDSAPHARSDKECACGKAGIYSAPVSLPIYAELFEQENKLDLLEDFASRFGADFYSLPYNQETITLIREKMEVPLHYPFGDQHLIPLKAGETLKWSIRD